MRRTLLGLVCAVVAVLPLTLVTAGAASAGKPVDRERYELSLGPVTDTLCGVTATFTATVRGLFMVRPVPRSDGQPFLAKDVVHATETWTTEAGSITIRLALSFAEQHATHVEGDVWQFQVRDSGTFRVHDAAGHLLYKANGVFKAQHEFDTLGDSEPGGVPVPGTFEVLHERGDVHDDDAFCAVVREQLT